MPHCISVPPNLSNSACRLQTLCAPYPTRRARNARHALARIQSFYVALERLPDNPNAQFCLAHSRTGITLIGKRAPTDALTLF